MRDVNLELGGLLLDMALVAGRDQRAWGFKRAARAVLRLDRQITPLVDANTFKAVPGIGPTTDRIARELIADLREGRMANASGKSSTSYRRVSTDSQHFLRPELRTRGSGAGA